MKTAKILAKIVVALAAVAGAVYVVATYGEQIVAWCKKTLENLPKCPKCVADEDDSDIEVEITVETPAEEAAEEVAAEEAPASEEDFVAEAPAGEPVAEEADFAE